MNLELQLEKFIDYHLNQGGQIHYISWQKSPESPYGVFGVDWSTLEAAGSPLSSDEIESAALTLTASWHTWMYCRTNPVVPEGMIMLPELQVREISNRLKAVIAEGREFKRLWENRSKPNA